MTTLDYDTYRILQHSYNVLKERPRHQNETVVTFMRDFVLNGSMTNLFTQPGLEDFTHQVFSNELVRDFVFDFSYQFYTHYQLIGKDKSKLANQLAYALAFQVQDNLSGENRKHSLVPEELLRRVFSQHEIVMILDSNVWMIPILLLSLIPIEMVRDRTQAHNVQHYSQ